MTVPPRPEAVGARIDAHLVTSDERLLPFDGLRGLAAASVVYYHLEQMLYVPGRVLGGGHLLVDLFFILSGFVIARQYQGGIESRRIGFVGYALRRLARLYPAYLLAFVAVVVMEVVGLKHLGEAPKFRRDAPILSTFLQLTLLHNAGLRTAAWNFPSWSVSVEWIVNLLFFVFVRQLRSARTPVILAIVYLCTACLMQLSPKTLDLDLWEGNYGFLNAGLARGLVGFGLGVVVFTHHRSLPRPHPLALHALESVVAMAAVIGLTRKTNPFYVGADHVSVLFFFPALVTLCLYRASWVGRLLSTRAAVFLGTISYSVYVLHIPLLNLVTPLYARVPSPWNTIGYGVLLLIAAQVCYRFVEMPGRALIRRWESGWLASRAHASAPATGDEQSRSV